jgi:hypothetical protein
VSDETWQEISSHSVFQDVSKLPWWEWKPLAVSKYTAGSPAVDSNRVYSESESVALPLFSFLIVYIVSRTPLTGDQTVALQTQNKRTQTCMP